MTSQTQTQTTSLTSMLSKPDSRKFKINTGSYIPAVGFGTWKSSPEDAYNSVKTALESGYRHIDAAWIYGNEPEVGRAIKDSGVRREDIFLTTKLWSTYHSRVAENLELSLKQLGVDYLDLYLMHWPVALNPNGEPPNFPLLPDGTRDLHDRNFVDTWKDMEKLLSTGKVKAIGVSNFDIHNLEILRQKCTVVPAVDQVEMHAYLQQKNLQKYCDERGIHITAYSPLGSTGSTVKTEKLVLEIASHHGCDPCAVLLAWGVQSGHSVLPKSINESRIRSNFQAVTLTKDEMEQIESLESGQRYSQPAWGVTVFHS
ncbi:Uncharacterized protein BP5553_02452 [Venustampulla echinocandica]|uniref:NADP-dependent oxidoreductase domain-containing protein n=1 Tax=Venustampulla echinocandica TaxID=2656787 RepID=A0A370U400_9HELO|nr:Uncharacterized protein BP5553_02452 [Venustampulla echinocandica]RDL42473.1 Uncharacterized protein BP5553_02452 [Venustampulla echinocandica]